MFKSVVYWEDSPLGEVEVFPRNNKFGPWMKEIRISCFSPPSDRSPPLAVLHTIAAAGFSFKMRSTWPPPSTLISLHALCLQEKKTAVVSLGDEELHLVALPSRENLMHCSRFWGFTVASELYNSCLVMLNRRCLGIVFDLDETLLVANTMRSFEDRINILQQKMSNETDHQRLTGMLSEAKRYLDDKSILKQYIETDQVVENGKVFKVQTEVVPLSSESGQISRPIIRLQGKNIILTRIDPAIRDTSVLVRVRPGWEDLRSYLNAKGRKRFEVYVCTMAEREYALEMWRLLDPESSLINCNELSCRIVCVKPESRKSLLSVFQDGSCHPNMVLVIDDRLTVWDFKDKSRVHIVPAFAPYYAPQAEETSAVPILYVARNVACSVRGGFFKEYDDCLLPSVARVYYEDEMQVIPSAPDVSTYLSTEEETLLGDGNKDALCSEGTTDVEVDRRLKDANCNIQAVPAMVNDLILRPISPFHRVMASSLSAVSQAASQAIMPFSSDHFAQPPLGQFGLPGPSLQGSPVREEGEINESELDPDTRRRLLILQHGQDKKDFRKFPSGPHLEVSVPPLKSPRSCLTLEEEMYSRKLNKAHSEFPLKPKAVDVVKRHSHQPSRLHGSEDPTHSGRVFHGMNRVSREASTGYDRSRGNHSRSNYSSFRGENRPTHPMSSNNRDAQLQSGRAPVQYPDSPHEVLEQIVAKCGAKVEYRTALVDTIELQFSFEVWLEGDKIGVGTGKTRKEARDRAAMRSIQNLADYYFTQDLSKLSQGTADPLPIANGPPEETRLTDRRTEGSITKPASVAALKELCMLKGFNLSFKALSPHPASSVDKEEVNAQVEVAGQVMGKGTGVTWQEAKLQASEEALTNLKSMLGQLPQKHTSSPRAAEKPAGKHSKAECSQGVQTMPSSSRNSKNEIPRS